jgi:Rrf2 family protein
VLSTTAQYALRAMVYIASQPPDRPVLAREIAARTDVPIQYLSRILSEAVKEGLLESARGIGGGFRLARPSHTIRLLDILAPYDDVVGRAKCPFGQPWCDDANPCGFHDYWKPLSIAYRRLMEQTTLDQVSTKGLGCHKSFIKR